MTVRLRISRAELASGLKLATGEIATVVVTGQSAAVTPTSAETRAVPGGGFGFDSSFPTPGLLETLRRAVADIEPERQLGVFGHADKVGSDQYNKNLSDRRARAILALLTGDFAAFEAVAIREGWNEQVYQAILRGLGCNPGPVDGKPGAMTRQALLDFQAEYNQGAFHRKGGAPALPFIAENGVLTLESRRALLDAYVSHHSLGMSPDRFLGPKFSGCSEFNPVTDSAQDNRRVTLALYGQDAPAAEDFPCTAGDASKCAIDDGGSRRCKFYRDHVAEPEEEPLAEPLFFDFEWFRRPDGAIQLSALTTLPDGEAAKIAVFQTEQEPSMPPPSSASDGSSPVDLGSEVGDTLDAEIRLGVCDAKFEPPDGFDPFDVERWLVSLGSMALNDATDDTDEDAQPDQIDSDDFFHPPLFRITAEAAWGYSLPPGERVARFSVQRVDDGPEPSQALVLGSDGELRALGVSNRRIDADRSLMGIRLAILDARGLPEDADV